jgi:hypothetical protein
MTKLTYTRCSQFQPCGHGTGNRGGDLSWVEPFRAIDSGKALEPLALWIEDVSAWEQVMVQHPARLYGFAWGLCEGFIAVPLGTVYPSMPLARRHQAMPLRTASMSRVSLGEQFACRRGRTSSFQ